MQREQLITLVQGVQNGDEAAFHEMYTTFQPDLYYYIFKTVNDKELAEDLTQDTFMEILRCIGSLQEPAAFVTWSRQIAFRCCTAHFKKRRELLADEDEDGYSVFDTLEEERAEFLPGQVLDHTELKQTIHGIINDLPPEQRSAIMLHYFEEMSVAQIAEIQGASEGTVKSRLNYGRKAIGKAVEEYEKKHDIKLHSAGALPLLLWLLRDAGKAGGAAGTAATASTATAAAAATTTASVAAAKTAGSMLAVKVISGLAAALLVIAGVTTHFLPGKTCRHSWTYREDQGYCTSCGVTCDHQDHITTIAIPQRTGGDVTMDTCGLCSWQQEPPRQSVPIYITRPVSWAFDYVTPQSLINTEKAMRELQSYAPGELTVTLVGMLYYYNDTAEFFGTTNNALVLIYHLDNGIVPGGWYTYLAENDVILRYIEQPDGTGYHTLIQEGLTGSSAVLTQHTMFYTAERFPYFNTTPAYPEIFQHEGRDYLGHATVEECVEALSTNRSQFGPHGYAHRYASPSLQNIIPDY